MVTDEVDSAMFGPVVVGRTAASHFSQRGFHYAHRLPSTTVLGHLTYNYRVVPLLCCETGR
jgi:hypothetical protein